jgi:hypothetical protein
MLLVFDGGLIGALPLNLVPLSRQNLPHNEHPLRRVPLRGVGDLVSLLERL